MKPRATNPQNAAEQLTCLRDGDVWQCQRTGTIRLKPKGRSEIGGVISCQDLSQRGVLRGIHVGTPRPDTSRIRGSQGLSTGYPPIRSFHPMFGFSSGCYCASMRPQYSSRLRRIRPKVHNEIRRYRLQLGVTQREVARRLGVRLSTFSSWERGMTCPSVPLVFKLAKLLSTLAEALYPDFYLVQETHVTTRPA